MDRPQNHSRDERRRLQTDSFAGFLGFFAFLSVVQAVINVLSPEPAVWPAVLALILVVATVSTWRYGRRFR